MESRLYWLSFVDPDRPAGERHLGCCAVEVMAEEADEALLAKPDMHNKVEGPWLAAACSQAWEMGCNPGGEVQAYRLQPAWPGPRNRLLRGKELEEWGKPNAVTKREQPD